MQSTLHRPLTWLLLAAAVCAPGAASAQTTLLRMDNGNFDQAWSLTSPQAGPGDWIGVAYEPPIEFPFRVVSATMYYIDEFCCSGGTCSASCTVFNDWDRRMITGSDLVIDPAGLTPDLLTPLVLDTPVGTSPTAFASAGSTATSAPWTLTPDVWTLAAGTIFDRPGRILYVIKYFDQDTFMRFIVQSGTQHPTHRAIFTNNGFTTRSSTWGFGNVGMQLTIEPTFFLKASANQPAPRFAQAQETSITMLAVRVRSGNGPTTVGTFQVDGSGSGNEVLGVQQVRLVLDQNANGLFDTGEPVLASGGYLADNGRLTLAPNRTLATGAAEEWLVVYDLTNQPVGGQTFSASITGPARVSSNLGSPYISGTVGGAGGLTGPAMTVAGQLQISAGPAMPAARVVPAGSTSLAVTQVRLTSQNEAFTVTGLAFEAAGSLHDVTEVTAVRLYDDADSDGVPDPGEALLASGTFTADNGRLAFSLAPFTVAANQSRDVLLVADFAAGANGGDTFRAVLATAADVTASGVASGPLPVTGPRALTGAPVIGELITVGGALTAQLGTASGVDGTAQPGATDVPMLQLTLSAQGEDVNLTTITFEGSGTGDETLDVARARLVRDVNGNGLVDGQDVQAGLPQSFAADDGLVTFSVSGEQVPTAGSRSFLLVYDFTAAPTGSETFRARVSAASAIVASGQASGAPVTAAGTYPITGRWVTLLGGLSLTLGPASPPAMRVQPGSVDVPVLQLSAVAQGETFSVSQLVLTAAGSLLDDQGIASVRLYSDGGTPGVRDAGDTLLGTATYGADDGQATFTFSPPLSLAPGPTTPWLITYDLTLAAAPGQTFRAAVAGPNGLVASGTLSGPATVSGLPAIGSDLSVGGTLTVAAGPANPAGGRLAPSTGDQAMLQIRVSTDLEPITVSAITLRGSGSGNEAQALTAVRLYVDTNQDGLVDPVGDLLLAGPIVFGQNDGPVTFALPGRTIAAAASEVWLAAYDLGATAQAGDTFQLAFGNNPDIAAAAPSGPLPRAQGAPIAGGTKTVLGSLSVARGPNTPGPQSVRRDALDVPVLQVRLTGAGESFSVSSLTFDAAGSADDVGHLSGATLVVDADGSGTRSAGDTVLAGPVAFSGDDGQVTFTTPGLTVPANGSVDVLVVVDLAGLAPGGSTLRLSLPGPTRVVATGFQGRSATPNGLPVSSDTLTTGGVLHVGLGAGSILGAVARRGDTRVPAVQLRFVAETEPVDLTQVTLHASGTADDSTGLVEVELWLDANADGQVSAGEARLAAGGFATDDGAVTLAIAQPVQVGPAVHLLATLSVSNLPVGGQTFRLRFDPAADLGFSSASGAVAVNGVAVQGGFVTVGGGFQVGPGPQSNPGGLVNQALQNIPAMQMELSAVNEQCTVEAITVRAAGSIHDAADVSSVQLMWDADDSGTVTAPDVAIGAPMTFADDDAELTFSNLNRALAPNVSERWLVVYDLSGQASNLESFSVRLESPARVAVRCQVSGVLTPAGTSIQGGTFTVQEDGSLVIRRGQQSPPPRFLAEGTVRAPGLQLRAAASVQPLLLERLVLTASVSGGAPVDTVADVDLFLDVNQDGQLDRSDQLLAAGGAPDGQGRVAFDNLSLTLPLDEAQFLLAAVNVAAGAAPGTRFTIQVAANADATASTGFGAALTTGAPISGNTMTVAGALNVRATRPSQAIIVPNDDVGRVGLDLGIDATWEDFSVRRITISAAGTMDPASAIQGLDLVVDLDSDGQVSAGDVPAAQGLTFPEGASRATFDLLDVPVPAGQSRRLLVLVDFDGTARVDQTLTLSLAADVDLVADGDRRGLTSPVGAPVIGDSFTVGASLLLADGPAPPADDVIPADATNVPILQLSATAANEDVTLTRLALRVSGSLDDGSAISAVHLLLDADGDGEVDPEDVEVAAAARPAGDDGVIGFGPLTERLSRNASAVYLVTVDLSGSGVAGQDVTMEFTSDADVAAFGARSGTINARGAPIRGARLSLVGTMNARLGPASPAGRGVWPGTTFGALQVELFTRGEAVTVDRLRVDIMGTIDPPTSIAELIAVHDLDGDGLAADDEPRLAAAAPDGTAVTLSGLGLSLAADDHLRILILVRLADSAAPGGTVLLSVREPAAIEAVGQVSGPVTVVGPPLSGSSFTVTRPPEVEGPGSEEGGCGCSAAVEDRSDRSFGALWALIVVGTVARRRRGAGFRG